MNLKIIKLLYLFIILGVLFFSCSQNENKDQDNRLNLKITDKALEEKNDVTAENVEPDKDADLQPITLKDIQGRWSLMYRGNYGYDIRFYKNYKALVILYLNTQAFVFKGIYTFDEQKNIKINIVEMKQDEKVSGINLYKGFVQVRSSYFLFNAHVIKKGKKKILQLKPLRVIIDGNSSDGYFEPLMKLNFLG